MFIKINCYQTEYRKSHFGQNPKAKCIIPCHSIQNLTEITHVIKPFSINLYPQMHDELGFKNI